MSVQGDRSIKRNSEVMSFEVSELSLLSCPCCAHKVQE